MRWHGRIQRIKRLSGRLVAFVKTTNDMLCIIPAQENWYPTMWVEFVGTVRLVDEKGYHIATTYIEVSPEAANV